MFIWEYATEAVMKEIMNWVYGQIIGFLGNFFSAMGSMGADLFEMTWVKSIVLFFLYLAWALYGTGLVVSVFECGIEYQAGRGSVKDTALNLLKGFLAVGLFSTVPIELYKLSVSMQSSFTAGITGHGSGVDTLAGSIISSLSSAGTLEAAGASGVFSGIGETINPAMMLFITIMMGYAVIKVFFANLKRGGILLIQIAVGSLYMFSVPRGYLDGFVSWCKQIVGLCLTAFLQSTILIAGLIVIKAHVLPGLGLMLAAGEIPRIAGAFGLDTSTKANLMGAANAAQSAVNTTRTIIKAVAAK